VTVNSTRGKDTMAAITAETFNEMIRLVPLAHHLGIRADSLKRGEARLVMPFGPGLSRPVNVVSGPALMTLADVALWAVVLSAIGPIEMAVTTSMTTNFLRKAEGCDIIAEARLLKLGRRLAVGAMEMVDAGSDEMVAYATGSYAIP
jgi:uncharacterized protein (TIGR00369 family)